jgi:hypothetical protein
MAHYSWNYIDIEDTLSVLLILKLFLLKKTTIILFFLELCILRQTVSVLINLETIYIDTLRQSYD